MPSYYDPFTEMVSLSDAINRLIADSFVSPRAGSSSGRGGTRGFMPPMDVQESGEDYIVKLSLPGWKPQDVNVSINGNVLTVSGHESETENQPQGQQQGQSGQSQGQQSQQQGQSGQSQSRQQGQAPGQHRPHYHLRERSMESFDRSFAFPTDVNADAAKANFENGVLTLTIPKAEAAKARRIPIPGQQRQLSGSGQQS